MEEDNIIYQQVNQPIAYEGASTSYRLGLQGLLLGDHDSLGAREVRNLIMRTEHACRNDGYAITGLHKYQTALGAIKVIWKDSKGKAHNRMQDLWEEFAENPNLDGLGTLDNTQSVWNASIFKTGSAFTRLQVRRTDNKNKIPLKLQPIPTYLHDISYYGLGTIPDTKYGITFSDTKPVTYYFKKGLYEQYWHGIQDTSPHVAIPANELLHSFFRESPGQWIGIPSLAPVLLPLYEMADLKDATIAKQKAAQAIAWIVENTNPVNMTPTGAPVYAKDKEQKPKVVFKATGGNTQYLNKGEKIRFYQSTDIGANLPALIKSELQRISAALDIPYHMLTGDTHGLDFSSIRAISIEFRSRLEYIHHFLTIPLALGKLCNIFKAYASLTYKVSNASPSYQLPRWYGVDELKDTQADLLEVQNGMATLRSKLDERHTTMEEIIEDRKIILEAGLDSILNPKQNTQLTNTKANIKSTSN